MNLQKAMIDLSIQRDVKLALYKIHEADALQLGIEALQFILRLREHDNEFSIITLPGETKELHSQGLPLKGILVQTKEKVRK